MSLSAEGRIKKFAKKLENSSPSEAKNREWKKLMIDIKGKQVRGENSIEHAESILRLFIDYILCFVARQENSRQKKSPPKVTKVGSIKHKRANEAHTENRPLKQQGATIEEVGETRGASVEATQVLGPKPTR